MTWKFVGNEEISKRELCKHCPWKRNIKNCLKMDLTIVGNWKGQINNLQKYGNESKLIKCKKDYLIIIEE